MERESSVLGECVFINIPWCHLWVTAAIPGSNHLLQIIYKKLF